MSGKSGEDKLNRPERVHTDLNVGSFRAGFNVVIESALTATGPIYTFVCKKGRSKADG